MLVLERLGLQSISWNKICYIRDVMNETTCTISLFNFWLKSFYFVQSWWIMVHNRWRFLPLDNLMEHILYWELWKFLSAEKVWIVQISGPTSSTAIMGHMFFWERDIHVQYIFHIFGSWKHTELVSMGYVLRTTQTWHNILIQCLCLINAVKYWALVTFRLVSHKVKWANSRVSKWRTQADRHLGFRYFIIHD